MEISELYERYLQHPVVTTDTRNCPPGSIFFALKGATFNGNEFARAAIEKGCALAVVDEAQFVPEDDARFVLVSDVLQTLQQLAAYHRQQLQIPVLQITGTNGKTTTKELVSAVLSRRFRTLCTQGNLNNHIGVPLTLLRIRPEHEMAVIETGANHPGEIAALCQMVQADYGLITNVGRAHLEGFGSFEGVKRTKGELYDDLRSRNARIFLNTLDEDLCQMAGVNAECRMQNAELKNSTKGGANNSAFCIPHSAIPYVEGRVSAVNPFLEVQWRKNESEPWHTVQTQLIGAYNIANVRAAVTVGLHFGVPAEDIDVALAEYKPTNSRSELRKTERNSLIVDAYNANPTSMAAALDNFDCLQLPRKMVILGEMRELGADSLAEHQRIVDRLQKSDVEKIWLVGGEFAKCVETKETGEQETQCEGSRLTVFPSVEEVKAELQRAPLSAFTILIKGSNGTKLFQLPELL